MTYTKQVREVLRKPRRKFMLGWCEQDYWIKRFTRYYLFDKIDNPVNPENLFNRVQAITG